MENSLFLPFDVKKTEDISWLLKRIRVCYYLIKYVSVYWGFFAKMCCAIPNSLQ